MPEYRHSRHFTAAEANAMLPRLTRLVVRLTDALGLLEGQREEAIRALMTARGNGKSHPLPAVDGLALVKDVVSDIETLGCILKDFDNPTVDFPALIGGKEVYLCWRFGEKEIQAWHGLDEGFAGRRPLPQHVE